MYTNKEFQQAAERYIREVQRCSPRVTPASTVLNSPDTTTYELFPVQQIKVGRSPVLQHNQHENFYGSMNDSGVDNSVVVFDDIMENSDGKHKEKLEHSVRDNDHEDIKSHHELTDHNSNSAQRSIRLPGFPQRINRNHIKEMMDDNNSIAYNESITDTQKQSKGSTSSRIGERLARVYDISNSEAVSNMGLEKLAHDVDIYLGRNSHSSGDIGDSDAEGVGRCLQSNRNFTLSPETTDYDSNCGDLDSFSNSGTMHSTEYNKYYGTNMPVLEDGLSSGHASDSEYNVDVKTNQSEDPVISMEEERSSVNLSSPHSIATDLVDIESNKSQIMDDDRSETPAMSQTDGNNDLDESSLDTTLQRLKVLPVRKENIVVTSDSPVWVPRDNNRMRNENGDEDEIDTDLETDRLLGQQRYDDETMIKIKKNSSQPVSMRTINNGSVEKASINIPPVSATLRQGVGTNITPPDQYRDPTDRVVDGEEIRKSIQSIEVYSPSDSIKSLTKSGKTESQKKARTKEGFLDPSVLIQGVLFRARYLGSTQLICEGQPTKNTRMMQAEEAVSRIKAPEGENQPSTEVDLFISIEKIMVLNTDLKEIMMDHPLRTISYIADIGDLVVLMARRRCPTSTQSEAPDTPRPNRTPKMICHIFESEDAQFIAQSIGQAFQVAYMEFLKANGIEDHSFVKEMDYQEVLNSQEIFGDELEVFARKELQKEVVVPKAKGEILGLVIVESGWGSMLPTVVIANLLSTGAAARCGQLNIGDQIIAINGLSMVGLPLTTCQTYIRNTKNQTAVKFTIVPCPPVVEVKIKRPNTKYQLGFSVQNGVICSLLRGGIAERGGVRVGHRIICINNQSVVAVPHEKIVSLLATSVGEITMKTMPTAMFRLLTGQENPVYI